jgi:hypothetical protein
MVGFFGSNDWAHFAGKHLNFPNVLFVCQMHPDSLELHPSLKQKMGISQLYIQGVIYSWYYHPIMSCILIRIDVTMIKIWR